MVYRLLQVSGDTSSGAHAQKKALIMTMGNTRDIRGLTDLLADESDDDVRAHIITVLAAMGSASSQVIDIFNKQLQKETSPSIRTRIEQALDVINDMSGYSSHS